MNDYDELYLRIRQMIQRHQAAVKEYMEKALADGRAEAAALVARFVAAGWTTVLDEPYTYTCVEVCDPNGELHRWYLPRADHLKDCLKALEAAEKAAQEKR